MKTTLKINKKVEMDFPLYGGDITLRQLRRLSDTATRNLYRDYPNMDLVEVDFVMHCDAAQRELIPTLTGFIPAVQFSERRPVRLDFGSCENFVFKWKH